MGLGAGTLFTLSRAASSAPSIWRSSHAATAGTPLFVQISDTHIGFNKDANPDVHGTLEPQPSTW